jgi:molybdate-binding protein
MALAHAFECGVEDLFYRPAPGQDDQLWAWPPSSEPCRFWMARVGEKSILYPVEPSTLGGTPHDGVFHDSSLKFHGTIRPESTLVMASCDPAAGVLASELARTSACRLLVLQRASRAALDLLRQGKIHLAGLHLTTGTDREGNADAARSILGPGFSLVTVVSWQEGLSLGPGVPATTVDSLLRTRLRWVGREPGSGARQCQDELLARKPIPRRLARDHRGVAEAIRCGWADVGVCVRLVSEEAGLKFIHIRDETYELCFPDALENDPRLRALLRVIRSRTYRNWLSELPGYDGRHLGNIIRIK